MITKAEYLRRSGRSGVMQRVVALGLALVACCVFLAGCADKRQDMVQAKLDYNELHNATLAEAKNLERFRQRERKLEYERPAPVPELEPMEPEYNPLDEIRISVDMKDTTLHDALYVVARHAGLNLVIDPEIPREGNRVTISFTYATTAEVLESLLAAYDYAWGVKRNVIFVRATEERTFDLGFLNVRTDLAIDSGGDIYGSSREEGAGANELTGNFKVGASLGRGVEQGSLYHYIEQNVRAILDTRTTRAVGGEEGEEAGSDGQSADEPRNGIMSAAEYFYIDPIAGTLFIRAAPRKVGAVSQLIDRLHGKMTKQVVIDARILEISLSDEFYLGVDWNWVLNRVVNASTYNIDIQTNTQVDNQGNPITFVPNSTANDPIPGVFTLNYAEQIIGSDGTVTETTKNVVEALQRFGGLKTIANPHIRARHAQPALITSGRTEAYLKEINREQDVTGDVIEETITTETAKAFSGVMLGVYPFIQGDEVDLQIFPIRSSVDLSKEVNVGETSEINITLPKVDVQNVHTSLHVRHGDTVIIGGLIDKSQDNADNGTPGLMSLPLFGDLFQHQKRVESVRELVIIMNIRVI